MVLVWAADMGVWTERKVGTVDWQGLGVEGISAGRE